MLFSGVARAQLYTANVGNGSIEVYDPTLTVFTTLAPAGTTSSPRALALKGNTLFVVDAGTNVVIELNATTGAVENNAFITGLSGPYGIAVTGNNLYVTNMASGTVSLYNASTGRQSTATLSADNPAR
jgi:DNA-binding beta-propeller fold protein YncE